MRKLLMLVSVLMLVLSACAPNFQKEEEIVQETNDTKEKAIIPKYKISDEYYRTILPFKPGEARGLVVNRVSSRLDIDEFEAGLMRIAMDSFSPKQYYFQEGQYLSAETVSNWLRRSNRSAEGLNPEIPESEKRVIKEGTEDEQTIIPEETYRKYPEYLSYVMEHNYLTKNDAGKVELGGVVIGLALNSVFYFAREPEGWPRYEKLDIEEIEKRGKDIAQTIVKRVRSTKGLEEVPIVIGLFKEEPKDSIVPGSFFAKGMVSEKELGINKWEQVNEEYYLFPSQEATSNYYDDAQRMANFKLDVEEYFPNFIGVIGKGFYQDEQLQELTIEIPIQFHGKAEVIGFTEYVTGLILDHFPPYINIQVYITSINGQESLIYREAGKDDPFVHIYH